MKYQVLFSLKKKKKNNEKIFKRVFCCGCDRGLKGFKVTFCLIFPFFSLMASIQILYTEVLLKLAANPGKNVRGNKPITYKPT